MLLTHRTSAERAAPRVMDVVTGATSRSVDPLTDIPTLLPSVESKGKQATGLPSRFSCDPSAA